MGKNNTLKKVGRKKSSKNVIKLIRKSNELVEARYKFDIWETRVFTKMLTMVQRHDSDFQEYRIYLKEIVRDFQIENNKDAEMSLLWGGQTQDSFALYEPLLNDFGGLKACHLAFSREMPKTYVQDVVRQNKVRVTT